MVFNPDAPRKGSTSSTNRVGAGRWTKPKPRPVYSPKGPSSNLPGQTKNTNRVGAGRWEKNPDKPKPKPGTGNTINTNRVGARRFEKTDVPPKPRSHRGGHKTTLSDYRDFNRFKARDKDKSSYGDKYSSKRSVTKDVKKASSIKNAAERRAYRTKKGLYLGKYYGPDTFQGHKELNAAWEKSGRKGSAEAFKRNYYNKKAASR